MTESNKGLAIPTDVYDSDGNMLKIEFYDQNGEIIIDVIWDPLDEQTSEMRTQFRKWAYRSLKQMGYLVNT